MPTKITPQEFHFAENRNNIDVRTTLVREEIDDAGKVFIQAIRGIGGISAGDDILVKVMNEDGTAQLHRRMFTVVKAGEVVKMVMDARGIESPARIMEYELCPVDDWISFVIAETVSEPEPVRVPENYVSGEGEVKWSAGKKAWDVMVGGEAVATIARLPDEGKDDYKARALAIAAGSDPLPVAA